jgi:hypothetical protein
MEIVACRSTVYEGKWEIPAIMFYMAGEWVSG